MMLPLKQQGAVDSHDPCPLKDQSFHGNIEPLEPPKIRELEMPPAMLALQRINTHVHDAVDRTSCMAA